MLEDFKSAFRRYNNAHIQLIIINVAVWVLLAIVMVFLTIPGYDSLWGTIHNQLAIPAPFTEFVQRPWTILTYMFVHDLSGILHILFNMLTLYWFGRLFVEYLGSDKLIAVYVLGGIAGAVAYLLAYNFIPFYIGRQPIYGMVGASASINAIVVAVATLLPNYTFFLLFFGPVRIKYIAAIIVFLSFLGTVGSNAGGNIAHLGGALIGFIYMKQLQSGINWGGWITAVLDWFRNVGKPKPKVKVTWRSQQTATPGKAAAAGKPSQDELDAILDKISAGGYESLTKEEKQKLFDASKK